MHRQGRPDRQSKPAWNGILPALTGTEPVIAVNWTGSIYRVQHSQRLVHARKAYSYADNLNKMRVGVVHMTSKLPEARMEALNRHIGCRTAAIFLRLQLRKCQLHANPMGSPPEHWNWRGSDDLTDLTDPLRSMLLFKARSVVAYCNLYLRSRNEELNRRFALEAGR
jgi:hypothetical protein